MASNNVKAPKGATECEKPTHKRFKDLTGQQYGRWEVVDYYGKKSHVYQSGKQAGQTAYIHYWLCQCECGEKRVVAASKLQGGKTTSCGCYNRELRTTHGLSSHPSYKRYQDMVARCEDSSHPAYHRYGGRGIAIYPDWLETEDNKGLKRYLWYLDNILGRCPGPEYSIDRIYNDKDYCPGNLRWADKSEQVRNRDITKLTREDALMIKFGNLPGTQKEIADQFGVHPNTVSDIRIGRRWATLNQADYAALLAED